jgi:ABC-type sugar transport system substrate-binding protein
MFKTFTLSAVLAAVLATTASAAFAAPKHYTTVPQTSAEWWQDRGNADDMGIVYRR